VLLQPLSRHAEVDSEGGSPGPEPGDRGRSDPAGKEPSRRPRRRGSIILGIVLCAVALIVAIAVGIMLFLTRDTSSPYRVGQALEQFKLLQQRTNDRLARTLSNLPAVGVYSYTTSGHESASAPALPTSASGYPSTSTMTIFSDSCGQDWRWQPLSNRYEDLVVCRSSATGPILLHSRFDDEEFYGVTDSRNYPCTAGSVFMPAGNLAGESLSGTCTNSGNKNSGGMSIAYSGEVVGTQTLAVGATDVKTLQISLHETISGDTVGTGTVSIWLDEANGLIIKETRTEITRSDSAVGWVPSMETFSLYLDSLTPRS
jgi:hypothetical protein